MAGDVYTDKRIYLLASSLPVSLVFSVLLQSFVMTERTSRQTASEGRAEERATEMERCYRRRVSGIYYMSDWVTDCENR